MVAVAAIKRSLFVQSRIKPRYVGVFFVSVHTVSIDFVCAAKPSGLRSIEVNQPGRHGLFSFSA